MCYSFWVSSYELFDGFFGIHVIPIDPLIVRCWITFPLDQVLYFAPSTMTSRVQNLLHFILFFSINEVRRGSRKVWSMYRSFLVWCKKIHMKYRMYFPRRGEC